MPRLSRNSRSALLAAVAVCGATLFARAVELPPLVVTPLDTDSASLSWDHADPGFVLQESDSPSSGGIWRGVPTAPAASGIRREVIRSVASDRVRSFFRLRQRGPLAGLDYLYATQDASGLWSIGSPTSARDTACALDSIGIYHPAALAIAQGAAALIGFESRNFDELSRRTHALAALGRDVSAGLATLLDGQNAAIGDPSALSYPGSGWGLAKSFGSSTLDTALVRRAIQQAGLNAGLCVGNEVVPAGTSSAAHPIVVPTGASGVFLRIQHVAGGTLRFLLTPPGSGTLFQDFAPRTTPINLGPLPSTAGTWTLVVQNSGGSSANYSAEFGFHAADGFDYFRVSSPLLYLARSQNTDGGWGLAKGDDSHLLATAEVVRCLAEAGSTFVGAPALANGLAWLHAKRNADGGFSSVPNESNLPETVLAINAIKAANPSADVSATSGYLRDAQGHDGSWGASPYLTAAAVRALSNPPVVDTIPGQSVALPSAFATIALDAFVTDADHSDDQITWTVTGNSLLQVSIANRVVTLAYPPATTLSETLTFTATDPDGLSDSTSATFTVAALPPVDYTIARGTSVADARRFSGSQAVLNQAVSFSQTIIGAPAGVTYSFLGITRPTATEFEIAYQIAVSGGAALGDHAFDVLYELFDAGDNPLGPLTGNRFEFTIRITP